MALETGTTIGALVSTNPVATDPVGQADDHLRLIKTVLKTTFGTITTVLDEDNMSTDSATALATQQSIKAYVDAQVTASDLDFQGDSGGALSIDLDSETLTVAGGTGIDTSGSSNTLTVAIDSTVATLTGSQVLTNKTLTSPVLNTGVSGTAVLDEDDLSSDSATQLATQQSIKAYVDAQVTAQDLDLTSDSGTIAIDLDSETLTVAGGTGIDSSATSNTVTLAIDSTVVTLAGSQTLTNKTLTSPTLNTPTIGTSFNIGSATITEAELEILDGASATTSELNLLSGLTTTTTELNYNDTGAAVGTVVASKVVTADANKDVASFRNITLTGELDAGSLDVSGDADIDGTLEADAITVDGTALNEYIADTVGAMVGSNTETNITVTYEDADNTLDFVIGTLNQDTTGTAALATSFTVTANNSADETVYPIFVDGVDGTQGAETDSGLTYNPSTGLLTSTGFSGNLTGTLQTAAQANVTSVGTLTSLTISGDLTVDTNTLKVDSSNNRVGINQASPDVSFDAGANTDAVHLPTGTTAQRPGSPAAGYFRYNSELSQFEGYTDEWGQIGGGGGSNTFQTDTFTTANDSTTAFTLSQAVEEADCIVFVDGVFQAHNAYSISGTTLTLSAAPASGRVVTAYSVKSAVGGSNFSIATMTGDNSDVTLTLPVNAVHKNNVHIMWDGVTQSKANYDIDAAGTTVTFTTAPPTGVHVEAIVATATSISTAAQVVDADLDTKIQVEESSDEDKIRFDTAGSQRMIIDNAGKIGIGNEAPLGKLTISSAAGANAPTTVTAANTYLQLGSDDYGASNNGKFMIGFGYTDATNTNSPAYIGYEETSTSGDTKGELTFYTRDVVTDSAPSERMRITSDGNLRVGSGGSIMNTSGQDLQIGAMVGDGSDTYIKSAGSEVHQLYNGSAWVESMKIDDDGHVTMPLQSSAMVQLSSNLLNLATSPTTLTFDTERFDQNGDFNNTSNSPAYAFVAPVTGKYLVCVNLYMESIDNAASYYQLYVQSTNRTYYSIFDPNHIGAGGDGDPTYWDMQWSGVINMDANDNVYFRMNQSGGTAQTDINQVSTVSISLLH